MHCDLSDTIYVLIHLQHLSPPAAERKLPDRDWCVQDVEEDGDGGHDGVERDEEAEVGELALNDLQGRERRGLGNQQKQEQRGLGFRV